MNPITATVRDGRLELDVPQDWPDGIQVEILPIAPSECDDDAPMSPDEIARTLAAMEAAEPLHFTEEELAAWEKDRAERRAWEKANFNQHADKLRDMWQ